MRRLSTCVLAFLLWVGCALLATAQPAQQRFPPPEFESGYQMPITQTPAPRALWLQYADVLVLAAALGLASYLVYKRRSRKALFGLSLFSLAYFGFYRKGCVCAIGSIQNMSLALFDSSYAVPLTVAAFFLLPVLTALIAGRTFCAGVCPHGALQDLVLLKPVNVPGWLEQGLGLLPFIYLGAGVVFAATGSAFVICRYDPFISIFRLSGNAMMVSFGIGLLLLGIFVGRPYCRFLCPYGALLRVTSVVSKWRVSVTPDECKLCTMCEESCPYGALRLPSTTPTNLAPAVANWRKIGFSVALAPVLMLSLAWVGGGLSTLLARAHPTVELAERYSRHQVTPIATLPQTSEHLSLVRAGENSQEIITQALAIRQRFHGAGWWLGLWVGLVFGVKLVSLSLPAQKERYEPDHAACVACARCFISCPRERLRLKTQTGALAPRPLSASAGVAQGKT